MACTSIRWMETRQTNLFFALTCRKLYHFTTSAMHRFVRQSLPKFIPPRFSITSGTDGVSFARKVTCGDGWELAHFVLVFVCVCSFMIWNAFVYRQVNGFWVDRPRRGQQIAICSSVPHFRFLRQPDDPDQITVWLKIVDFSHLPIWLGNWFCAHREVRW